jgi:hypothetical protein
MSKKDRGGKRETNSADGDFRGTVFNKTAALAALAMRGANFWQRFVVYACYVIVALALVVMFIPPQDTTKQLAALAVAVTSIVAALFFVLFQYRNLMHAEPPPVEPRGPSPGMIALSQADIDGLLPVLENARSAAFKFLGDKNPALQDNEVRANIFFPVYGSSRKWDDYFLRIHPQLHLKMNREAELGIELEPGQGVTGETFGSGGPRIGRRLDEDSAIGWPKKHRITPELEEILDPSLKWVISMPIKGAGEQPLGVLSIDGLTHDFGQDSLQPCMQKLTPFAFIMGGLIRR